MPTRRELNVLQSKSLNTFHCRVIHDYWSREDGTVGRHLKSLNSDYLTRWRSSNRSKIMFERKYCSCLDVEVDFQCNTNDKRRHELYISSEQRGCPKKTF